jgi:hypothetical protein
MQGYEGEPVEASRVCPECEERRAIEEDNNEFQDVEA